MPNQFVEVCPPPVTDPADCEKRHKFIRDAFDRRYIKGILRKELFHRQNGLCRLCDNPLQDGSSFFTAIDHGFSISHFANSLLPIDEAEDAANHFGNLYAVHPACNSAKKCMNIDEWDAGNHNESHTTLETYYKIEEQRRKKIAAAHLGRTGTPWSDTRKQKVRAAISGSNNPFYGKVHTKETRERIAQTKLSKKFSVAKGVSVNNILRPKVVTDKFQRQLKRLVDVGRFQTEEWKKRMSEKMKDRVFTPLHRQRLSEANRRRKRSTKDVKPI